MRFTVGIYDSVKMGVLGSLVRIDDSVPRELSGSTGSAIAALQHLNLKIYEGGPGDEFQVYKETIDSLADHLGKVGNPASHRLSGVFMWIFLLRERFFELVRERDSIALVILAHFCVVLHDLRKHWWISSWGYRVFDAVYKTVNQELRSSLSWASFQIGQSGNIS